jgi:hypothetical protein
MKIKIGKVFKNRTLKYVLPMIKKYYDDTLVSLLNSVGILAVGIGDFLIEKDYKQHVFVLVDSKVNPRIFNELIYYVEDKEYYEDDYSFDNLLTGRLQMIIFKLPEDIIQTFLLGKYSKMYYFEDACEFLKNDNAFDVIIKNKKHKPKFIKEVKTEFGTELKMEEVGTRELDIPPIKKEEIFNYKD